MNLERWYLRLPVYVQNLLVSGEGWRIQRRRFGPDFDRRLAEYESRDDWSAETLTAHRDARLAAFVQQAAAVPYYRELFTNLGIDPADLRGLSDLSQLPILSKATVQSARDDFATDGSAPTLACHTSGTTGAGLKFLATWAAHQEQWAVWWRYRRWHGLDRNETCLYFGGRSVVPLQQSRPPYWRYNRPGRQVLFSGYHLSPRTAHAYLDCIERSGARWLHGYPSLIALIAQYALELGRRLPIRWVTLGAESLLPQQAAVIRAAFGEPLQHYGLAEGVANISQCPHGRLHVDEDYSAVEFVPAGDGQYRVIGTNFTNPAFPLLRYDTGDLVTCDEGPCPCGRAGRLVSRIDGRREDYVITRSGARLGRLDHIFKDMIHVREAQIVQTRPGQMTLRIVRGAGFSAADEQLLRQETWQRVGDEVRFELEYVDALPRSKTGKLRLVVSTLRDGQIAAEPQTAT